MCHNLLAVLLLFFLTLSQVACQDTINESVSGKELTTKANRDEQDEKDKSDEKENLSEEEPVVLPPVLGPPIIGPGLVGAVPLLYPSGGGRGTQDLCPRDAKKTSPGICGCGVPDLDADNDYVIDCIDNCPTAYNPEQVDVDEDKVGAACDCDDENDQLNTVTMQARYVSPTGNNSDNNCLNLDTPCQTIAYAIAQSVNGDTIVLGAGSFLENTILVNKNLSIVGKGPVNSIVNAQENGRVFLIAEDIEASICGITITGGFIEGEGTETNLAPGAGGGVFNDGYLLLSKVVVEDNSANLAGGGLWNNTDSEMHIKNSTIRLNTAGQSVGGFGNYYLSTMTIDNTLITENTSGAVGGAGGSAGNFFSLTNSTVSNNTAPFLAGGLILVNGLIAVGSVQIENTEFSGNAGGLGGALITNGIGATIENSRFLNNTASQDAGAIAVVGQGVLQVSDSTFSGNTAAFSGGGILLTEDSRAFLVSTTIAENNAASGGGISVTQSSEAFITNSTLSTNTATLQGGGVYEDGISSVTINFSTIAFNTALNGGGIYKNSNSLLNTYHSILSNNIVNNCESDSGDVINSANFSLFSDASCSFSSGTDNQVSIDPLLGPLQNNGGPTETHALLGLSPAIDAGDTICTITFDQRGEFRPVNIVGLSPIDAQARCDIGSFEAQLP